MTSAHSRIDHADVVRLAEVHSRGYRVGEIQPGDVTDVLRTDIRFPTVHHAATFADTMLAELGDAEEFGPDIYAGPPATHADIRAGVLVHTLHGAVVLTVMWAPEAVRQFAGH